MERSPAQGVSSSRWAIVLAGGDGARLCELTRDPRGRSVPKQFCSLRGGETLLETALARARSLVQPDRILVVVRRDHRSHWESMLASLPVENVLVQPENRGTAPGLLLPLLELLHRDRDARVVVLPSDHYVRDEPVLESSLNRALFECRRHGEVVMLGMTPDSPDTEYGWIVPGANAGVLREVERFVEKPEHSLALRLLATNAVWNSFILVGQVRAFTTLFEMRQPELTAVLSAASAIKGPATLDFSRDVLEGAEAHLRVLLAPPCGWSDLGTPGRIAACLRSGARAPANQARASTRLRLDLALAALGSVSSPG